MRWQCVFERRSTWLCRRDIWGATIIFGPVVFQLFGTTILPLLEGLVILAPNTHLLWPYKRDIDWLPRPGFDDLGVVQFADGFLDELQQHGRSMAADATQ